jgi:glucosylceramidase
VVRVASKRSLSVRPAAALGITMWLLIPADPAPGLDTVNVWLTRGDDENTRLEARPALTFQAGAGSHSTKINLDPIARYQTMEGFGAAVTDSAAWLIQNELSGEQRNALMETLFSSTNGIGLSYVRIPMGASDFALTAYTYDDMPIGQTDPTLANFSIAHDLDYIIPTLLDVQAVNPDVRFMATPWSPPAWMKNPQTLFGGSLESQHYATYADYFVRFIQDYAAEGIDINLVSVQNEPLKSSTGLPSASMATFQQSTFIGDHLGPAFASAGIDTIILAYDHNWDEWNYPVIVMNDPEAGPFIAGSAFHGYAGDVANQSNVHDYFPDKDIYFTEISGGEWSPNFADNLVWEIRNIIVGGARNWAKTALMWNIALDESHGPHLPGGCADCRGVVTIGGGGAVTREVEYYVLGHASKFVQRGAQRIGSDSIDGVLEAVAFRNPDGTEVLIALNPQGGSQWFDLVRGGECFSYRLTGQSVATFVWDALEAGDFDNSAVVNFDDVDDGDPANANSLVDFYGTAPPWPQHDLASDGASAGVIDQADLAVLVEGILGSKIGDLDRDLSVTLADAMILIANLGSTGGYFDGDLDGNREVNLADFAILQANFEPT